MGRRTAGLAMEKLVERYAAGERDFSRFVIAMGDFGDPRWFGTDLSGTKFRGFALDTISLQALNFSGADLRSIYIDRNSGENTNFSGADLRKSRFHNLSFMRANLIGANFSKAMFDNVSFTDANLTEANFSGAKFKEVWLNSANLTRTDFSNAIIKSSVECRNRNLIETNFTGVQNFEEIDFSGAYFKNTILPDGTIRNSD